MTYKTNKNRKQLSINLRDKDGMPVYSAETLHDALMQTREYIKFLLSELPDDYELRIYGLMDALYPLEWLTEEAIMTDVRK